MELLERIVYLLIGGFIGFVLGYIIAALRDIEEMVEEVDKHVMHEDRRAEEKKKPSREGLYTWLTFQNVSFAIVILLTVYAAFSSSITSNRLEQNYKDDLVARCQAGPETRNVQRATIDAVFDLSTGLAQEIANNDSLNKKEIEALNRYIDSINEFRSDMYKRIGPSELCAPYVDDENVQPPTEDYPRIKLSPKESE